MTDPSFDELASAHLDGATTPEEAAQIAADPALQARVEELRQVREAVAEVGPADPGRREAAIAAAIAAFDDAEASPVAPGAPVTPLRARAPHRGPSPRAVRILGAAAAVALLAVLVPLLGRLADSGRDDEASFNETGAAIERGAETLEDSAADRPPATTTTRPLLADHDLGRFDDLDSLAAAVAAAAPETGFVLPDALAATGSEAVAACPSTTASGGNEVASPEVATATVAGDPVVVVLRRTTGDGDTLYVYRAADCALLGQRSL